MISWQSLSSRNSPTTSNETAYTILCIGDSWTAGQPSGNYPDELQKIAEQVSASPRLKVINLGYGGANSSQGIRRLSVAILKYQPRIVLVMIGNNDHWNLSESAYWQFMDTDMSAFGLLIARMRVFFHSLRVYKLGKILYAKLRGLPTPNEFYYLSVEGQESSFSRTLAIDREVHRKQLEYNLIHYIELSRLSEFQLIFQTYFHFHGYHVNEIIRDVALTYHIPLVDNNILFHQKIPLEQRDIYLIQDGHPSKIGYQFIAENVLAVLEEEHIISREDGH